MEHDLFHGADSRKLLFNLRRGGLTADNLGKLYFSRYQWSNCLVHGTDSETHESYVVKVRIDIPAEAHIERGARAGNPDALIVTVVPGRFLPCTFLEMYVRRGTVGSFETSVIPGPSIEAYLDSVNGGGD